MRRVSSEAGGLGKVGESPVLLYLKMDTSSHCRTKAWLGLKIGKETQISSARTQDSHITVLSLNIFTSPPSQWGWHNSCLIHKRKGRIKKEQQCLLAVCFCLGTCAEQSGRFPVWWMTSWLPVTVLGLPGCLSQIQSPGNELIHSHSFSPWIIIKALGDKEGEFN